MQLKMELWELRESLVLFFKQIYYSRKKIYECINCGKLAAPRYEYKKHRVLTNEYGWKRLPSEKFVCHTCAYHSRMGTDPNQIYNDNERLKLLIRNIDHKFYVKEFGDE